MIEVKAELPKAHVTTRLGKGGTGRRGDDHSLAPSVGERIGENRLELRGVTNCQGREGEGKK